MFLMVECVAVILLSQLASLVAVVAAGATLAMNKRAIFKRLDKRLENSWYQFYEEVFSGTDPSELDECKLKLLHEGFRQGYKQGFAEGFAHENIH